MKRARTSRAKQRGLTITRLLARDGDRCAICDLPLDRRLKDGNDPMYITLDHIVPRSRGGHSDLENLRLAHQLCNNERGNDPLEDTEC